MFEKAFADHRSLLFAIAHRMLGSVMDAEDVLQEAYLRARKSAWEKVENPRAYLSSVVTRLCIDAMRSARYKREQYIGPWLPEPLVSIEADPLEEQSVLAESLTTGFLVLLEALTPVERGVYLLRAVFEYDYAEISGMVGKSEGNCRKIFSRARQYIRERRPRFNPTGDQARKRQPGCF